MREENVFLNANGYLVTNARFEVPGQTYVMAGVTSVKVTKTVPNKFWPITWLILGTLFVLFGILTYSDEDLVFMLQNLTCGGILLLLGGLMLMGKKTVYHLILTTAAGEQKATSSTNQRFMQSLRVALTNAIIDRG